MGQEAPAIKDLPDNEFDALIERLKYAQAHGLAISAEDLSLVLEALMTLASVQERLASHDITLQKLRKLLGMVKSSESLRHLITQSGNDEASNENEEQPPLNNKKKRSSKKPPSPEHSQPPKVYHHALDTVNKGDICPQCERGKLNKYEPANFLRIVGQAPFQPERHVMERLRCSACGEYFTAPLPDDVLSDGKPQQKYGYSARSLMAIFKCFGGLPMYRQETLQSLLGCRVSHTTIFDQCEHLRNAIHPIYQTLLRLAAQAHLYYIDDTRHRILDQKAVMKKRRNSDKLQKRTQVNCSGLIAHLLDGHTIILFQTNIGHAGEWIDDILAQRESSLSAPILMSDALSHNQPTQVSVVKSLCNSHGRRNYAEMIASDPKELTELLKQYALIWAHDEHCQEQQLTEEARMTYHKEHSLPCLQAIKQWGEQRLSDKKTEPNSGLGKAIAYFDRHFEGLSRFCTHPGVPIDNNWMEQTLKRVIRHRNNSLFFKTAEGAAIHDELSGVIGTAMEAKVNVQDYLIELQRHQEEVKQAPEKWLPWSYKKQLNRSG